MNSRDTVILSIAGIDIVFQVNPGDPVGFVRIASDGTVLRTICEPHKPVKINWKIDDDKP